MTDHIDLTTGTLGVGRAAHDPHLAAEQAGVAQYPDWITAASLQVGPHTPGVWTVPAVVDDEPEGLAWLPRNAWKTEGDK